MAFLVAIVWPSDFTRHKIPMPLFVALAAGLLAVDPGPPVLSLYSKLIGQGNAGLYFSVLQSNGAVARAILGQLVGLAFGRLGPPSLWISCLILLVCSCLIMVRPQRTITASSPAQNNQRRCDCLLSTLRPGQVVGSFFAGEHRADACRFGRRRVHSEGYFAREVGCAPEKLFSCSVQHA